MDRDPKTTDATNPAHVYEEPDLERPASATPTEAELLQEKSSDADGGLIDGKKPHDPYAALRYPEYIRFSAGWMLSVVGNLITLAALQWEIYDKTKSSLNLGLIGGAQAVPLLALALVAGAIADKFDRRRIVGITAAMSAVCSVGLAVMSYNTSPYYLAIMYALILLQSTVLVLGRPARSAILPNLVPPEAFSNAVAWNASVFQTAAMIGPMIGGIILVHSLKWFGNVRLAYLLDAVLTMVFAVVMFTMDREKPREKHANDANADASAIRRLTAGVRFVWNTRIILATITLDLFAVLLGGAVYLMPIFAKDILNVGPIGFTWLRAAEAMGAVTMAVLVAHMPPMKKAGRAMLWAVAGFGAATLAFGLSKNFYFSFAMIFLIGAFDNISVVVRHTLVQVLTPDHMRGRVSAVNNIFIGASNELGGLESGLTAKMFASAALTMGWAQTQMEASTTGATLSVVVGGSCTVIVVAAIAIVFPGLLKLGTLHDLKAIEQVSDESAKPPTAHP